LSDLKLIGGSQAVSIQQSQPRSTSSFTATILITALTLFAFLPFLGSFGIIDPSDGLYTEGAREMVQSSNYLTPQFNFAPFYEKPILIYWIISTSYKLFGISEFAARLPIAVSGILTVFAIYLFVTKYFGTRGATLCALVTLSNPLFLAVGHLALTDMPLTSLATIAMLSFFHSNELRTSNNLRISSNLSRSHWFAYLGYALLALTVLLKGPSMLLMAATTLCTYHLLIGTLDSNVMNSAHGKPSALDTFLRHRPLAGILIMAAIAAPWYIVENTATKGAFFQEFVFRQNLGRLNGALNHTEPFWFYIPVVFGSFMPWTLLSPYAIPFIKRLFKRSKSFTSRQRLLIFCLSWMVVNYTVFSVIRTKLPTYILPAVPLTCVLIGGILDTYLRKYQLVQLRKESVINGAQKSVHTRAIGFASIWCVVMALIVPLAIIHIYNGKSAALRTIVESVPESNLSTFWRDTTSGVFYHRKKITVVFTTANLNDYLKTPDKPHMMVVTEDLIPFLKLEMKNPYLVPIRDNGIFCLFNLDEPAQRKI
jgi:4-amino-4-deoxy-L-arabinose transferase-like glycosyltransferase